jgi:hypothetical protein
MACKFPAELYRCQAFQKLGDCPPKHARIDISYHCNGVGLPKPVNILAGGPKIVRLYAFQITNQLFSIRGVRFHLAGLPNQLLYGRNWRRKRKLRSVQIKPDFWYVGQMFVFQFKFGPTVIGLPVSRCALQVAG